MNDWYAESKVTLSHECPRCHARFPESEVEPVSLFLRIVALPMIFVIIAAKPFRIFRHELGDKYCRTCRRGQTICYIVVGIWSMALVIGVLHRWFTGQPLVP